MSAVLQVRAVREPAPGDAMPFDLVLLSWRERRSPTGVAECVHGDLICLDMPPGITLKHGTRLFIDDCRNIEVIAAEERLAEITGQRLSECERHLMDLGVAYQKEPERLLISRGANLEDFFRQIGATVRHVSEPFEPCTA